MLLAAADAAAQSVPTAPLNLTAEPQSTTDIELDWDAPATTNGSLTGYVIEKNDGSMWEQLVDTSSYLVGATDTEYLDGNVPEGGTRSYRVKAKNANGTGPASNVATATAVNPPLTIVAADIQLASLRLEFNLLIDHTSNPGKDAFTVKFEGKTVGLLRINFPTDITQVGFSLNTSSHPRAGERVTISDKKWSVQAR